MADVAPQPCAPLQFVLDRRAVVGEHATENRRRAAVTHNGSQELNVGANSIRRTRWIEEHEAEIEYQAGLLYRLHGPQVLFHGDLLVQNFQPLLVARLEAHVDQVESRIAHRGEDIRLHCIGAAVYLPDRTARESCAMQLSDKLVRPPPPN